MKKNNLILTIAVLAIILFSTSGYTQTVTIGSQVWTSKNLDVSTYRNGDTIPQVQNADTWVNLKTGAWCYGENKVSNGTKYGKLYNWYAVNDPRGLAPKGYHIPTDAEWKKLTDYFGGTFDAGTKMKSTIGWIENGNGTNSSGFSGLPGGYRTNSILSIDTNGYISNDTTKSYSSIGTNGFWWSSTEDESVTINAWMRDLNYYYGSVNRNSDYKNCGFSVRCIKD
jgi:uncharacterized protein (TIGR02145 family)